MFYLDHDSLGADSKLIQCQESFFSHLLNLLETLENDKNPLWILKFYFMMVKVAMSSITNDRTSIAEMVTTMEELCHQNGGIVSSK